VNTKISGKHITKSHVKYQYHASKYHDKRHSKISQKLTKSKQIARDNTHIFFIKFYHAKISQKHQENYQEFIEIY
jgi:hypothetical protein